MRAWFPVLLLVVGLSGCATGDNGSGNPNLLAPKLLLASRDGGNLTAYVHSAFGEHAYDWLTLRIDNATVTNRTGAYAIEEGIARGGFFLEITGASQDSIYQYRARVDAMPDERIRVAALDSVGVWAVPRTYNLPFEQILDHPTRAG